MNSFEGNEVQAHTIWKQRGKKRWGPRNEMFYFYPSSFSYCIETCFHARKMLLKRVFSKNMALKLMGVQ